MSKVGQREIQIRRRVVNFFKDTLGYASEQSRDVGSKQVLT